MDVLQSYDAEDVSSSPPPDLTMIPKSSAPKVDDTMLFLKSNKQTPLDHVVNFNPTYDQLWGPPSHPYAKDESRRCENPASDVLLILRKNRKSPRGQVKRRVCKGSCDGEAEQACQRRRKANGGASKVVFTDKSTFHGKEERDYQGRSWIAPPNHARRNNDHCYVPNRLVHTWSGHTKGVSAIRFFPRHGHLLLSAGMDSKVKIWDVFNSGKCMRTYMGHGKAVRDISFCNDGSKFLTVGYDKNIKYWDTETGQVISTFSTGKMPYVVKLNPDDDKQNILLAGTSDNKIVQRFVTSSDDKSLRVWEFGIPVMIKYISEPHMHSIPAVSLHPNGNWLAAQSLDNQVNFSPDGRFVMSGDGEGRCWFWDWKSCKVKQMLKCHESVCIGAEWHPLEQSKVATCGWDGLIKYWTM
ncbi:pre-mRNA-processing factor 17 isoform X1 [Tanacetum coccineum]